MSLNINVEVPSESIYEEVPYMAFGCELKGRFIEEEEDKEKDNNRGKISTRGTCYNYRQKYNLINVVESINSLIRWWDPFSAKLYIMLQIDIIDIGTIEYTDRYNHSIIIYIPCVEELVTLSTNIIRDTIPTLLHITPWLRYKNKCCLKQLMEKNMLCKDCQIFLGEETKKWRIFC